ncbi:MAG: polyphosphate:AMP phosphotransferase, partial [Chloroflexi bacterium]|nr:polyphosphate:AMP phosphotransferase [Chloroflexota bacterium]
AEDMLLKTSTTAAPWTVVPSNDKLFARVMVLKTVVEALERKLDRSFEQASAPPEEKKHKKKKK